MDNSNSNRQFAVHFGVHFVICGTGGNELISYLLLLQLYTTCVGGDHTYMVLDGHHLLMCISVSSVSIQVLSLVTMVTNMKCTRV